MKLLPILAINLAVTGVVLLAYDIMRAGPAPVAPTSDDASASAAPSPSFDAIDERLRALEDDRRRPRGGTPVDASVLQRLAALEAAAKTALEGGDAQDAAPPQLSGDPEPDAADASSREPTPAEIARFRVLREAVRRADVAEKNAERVDMALDRLGLNLSDREREQIHAAHAAFQPQIKRIWGEAKEEAQLAAGGGKVAWSDVIVDTTARIEREFAATLEGIVSASDSEAIARALLPREK